MAKKKKAEGDEEEAKGGGKKKIIIIVVALVAAFGAKTMLFKAETPAQVAAKKVAAEAALEDLCNRQNNVTATAETTSTTAAGAAKAATATTVAATTPTVPPDPLTERGPVLELDSKTVNLADGHYLKIGIALQLDKTGVVETAKDEGLGAKALDMARRAFSTKTMDELAKGTVRDQIQQQLGLEACHAYEGEVLTVFFTDFVMQ